MRPYSQASSSKSIQRVESLAHAVEAGLLREPGVTQLGAVLARDAEGRRSGDEITTFDSTGLAIQDLAIATAALSSVGDVQRVEL